MRAKFISGQQSNTIEMPLRLGRCLAGSGVRVLTRCHIIAIDGALREPFERQLMPQILAALRYGPQRVRLDLSRLTSIDAAGVGELITAFNATKGAGGVMDITHARGPVRRVLEVTGVYPLLTVSEAASAA